MASASLSAEARTETGKGAARKLRAAGRVPAVIYGHNREPQGLSVNARELNRLLEHIAAGSTVIELGGLAAGATRTLIREIQRHPLKRHIVHVDFQELVAGEKISVSCPLVFVGTPAGVREQGGLAEEVMRQIQISVDPASIPNHIDVDVSGVTIGHPVHVADLKLPDGVVALEESNATVFAVAAPRTHDETAATPEASTAAEPEVIRAKKPEE